MQLMVGCSLTGDVIIVRIGDIVPADIKLLGDESDTSSPLQASQHPPPFYCTNNLRLACLYCRIPVSYLPGKLTIVT